MQEWVGKRIAMVGTRYIWRGKLDEIEGPFLVLTGGYQVTDHGEDAVREEMPVGRLRLNPASAEAIYLEEEVDWFRGR